MSHDPLFLYAVIMFLALHNCVLITVLGSVLLTCLDGLIIQVILYCLLCRMSIIMYPATMNIKVHSCLLFLFSFLFNFIYRKAAQKWHPDNFQGDEKKIAEKRFIDIAAAKEVLTDPGKPNFMFKLATQMYVQCFCVITLYI